jgi:hypothetical protein
MEWNLKSMARKTTKAIQTMEIKQHTFEQQWFIDEVRKEMMSL